LQAVRLSSWGRARSTAGVLGATAYGIAFTLYGTLKKVAPRHLEIRAKLAPVAEFLVYRRPKARPLERADADSAK